MPASPGEFCVVLASAFDCRGNKKMNANWFSLFSISRRYSFDVASAVVRAPPDRVRLRKSQRQATGKDVDEVRLVGLPLKPKL